MMELRLRIKKTHDHFRRQQGSALILVIIILLAMTITISLIQQGNWLNTKAIIQGNQRIQAFYLAEAAVYKTLWYLAGHEGKNANWRPVNEEIRLMDDQTALVTITDWGGFLRIQAVADWHGQHKKVCVIAGQVMPRIFQSAIILGGEAYPLVVNGNNRITGDVHVGERGVEPGIIATRGFTGDKLVDGEIYRHKESVLPELNSRQLDRAFQALASSDGLSGHMERYQGDLMIDSVFIAGLQSPGLFVCGNVSIRHQSKTPLLPDGFTLRATGSINAGGQGNLGHGLILKATQVVFKDRIQAEDCQIYADSSIIFKDACHLSAQAFCAHVIRLQDEAVLRYPSVLYSPGSVEGNQLKGSIELADRAVVQGSIFFRVMDKKKRNMINDVRIEIGGSAQVTGIIYSDSDTQMKGTVYGCVAVRKFYLFVPPTTCYNWMRDATIDRTRLPESFLLPLAFEPVNGFEIVKWEKIDTPEFDEQQRIAFGE